MASTYLTNTPASPTNRYKYTFSFWAKRSKILLGSSAQRVINVYADSNNKLQVAFGTDDRLSIFDKESGVTRFSVAPSMRFRDPNAWYHIVFAVDTTQSTESDRIKVYVNGQIITEYESGNTYAGQNTNTGASVTGSNARRIGTNENATSTVMFDGLLSHFHHIDGTAYAASDFGESDSVSGIWKPKTSSLTYGANGFFLKFENSGAMGTDSSGNGNNFTVTGTLTQTVDTPSNNFVTLNPLDAYYTNSTFSNGNLTFASGSSFSGTKANILLDTGKWYWEVKPVSKTGDTDNYTIGIIGAETTATNQYDGYHISHGFQYYGTSGQIYSNGSGSSYGNTYTAGDIIGVALDLDNNKLYFSKNGTFQNSGVPTSGSTGTGAVSITDPASVTLGGYYPSQTFWSGSSATFSVNFGQGYFGTTVVASAGTAPSEGGIFEYDCPSGYQALCTKGINSF